MLGLKSLKVYISIFNTTEENCNFELCKFADEKSGGVSYEKIRDENAKVSEITDNPTTDLQIDIIGPLIIEEYRNQLTKRLKAYQNRRFLEIYVNSIFQDFEGFFRTEVDLVEDAIRLDLDEYISSFITYELEPGIHTFEDLYEALFNILQPEYEVFKNSVDIEFDDNTKKTKMVVR